MTALPAGALAAALTFAIGDSLKDHISSVVFFWIITSVIFVVIYKISHHYLKSLKD